VKVPRSPSARFHSRLSIAAIEADPGQVEQVILNLAVNARDAMRDGGTLVLRTHRLEGVPDSDSDRLTSPPAPMVRLTVSDTGAGIAPETRPRIFEPFFTTKGKGQGTGLGLATVYGIVRQSGGRVGVESKPGEGSSFLVDLPATTQERLPAVVTPTPAGLGGHETVLLVEDEASVRRLLQRMLEEAGYRVLAAAGGHEALELVAVLDSPVDLLVSDVVMHGTSGPALAEQLCADQPELRVPLHLRFFRRARSRRPGWPGLPRQALLARPGLSSESPSVATSRFRPALLRAGPAGAGSPRSEGREAGTRDEG
jgi:CheY-like chemotaxis protein